MRDDDIDRREFQAMVCDAAYQCDADDVVALMASLIAMFTGHAPEGVSLH